jgi:hypothetical protein
MTSPTTDLAGYERYVECLHHLHRLVRRRAPLGEGDSEMADVLRGEMDAYWANMTPEQLASVRRISAGLNSRA